MSAADNSPNSTSATERKVWETPTVIVGTTRDNTHSNINTLGVDGHSPMGSSYGS